MIVLKFGGSSVGTPERIKGIITILKEYYSRGEHFTVVCSAFSGVTDLLLDMADKASKGDAAYKELLKPVHDRHLAAVQELLKEHSAKAKAMLDENFDTLSGLLNGIFLLREASPRTLDHVVSFGERNSNLLIAYALQESGIAAAYLDARKVIRTDANFGSAKVDFDVTNSAIEIYYQKHPEVQVVTGFIGATTDGTTTTLGRGGSDYTAAILGAALNASVIEIWTDVDGVLTADPRKVKKAFTIPVMTYGEAMELSHFGAKVIYPPTIQPALAKKIPLYIKNTFNPTFVGTLINEVGNPNGHAVRGISSINHIALLTLQGSGLVGVPGSAARLFNSLAQADINVILITQGSSEHSISFAVTPSLAEKARQTVTNAFRSEMDKGLLDSVKVENDLSVIAIVGEGMRYRSGVSGDLFTALGNNGINISAIAQGSSELNISVVVSRYDEAKALNALHESFFLSDTRVLNVFMIGVGLIGSTLLRQIHTQSHFLKSKRSLEIKFIGLANTKRMVFDDDGIDIANWEAILDNTTINTDIAGFIYKMREFNLSNTIFVDNTANEQLANFYEQILDNNISISTPNKIATSSSYLQYNRLKTIAEKRGVPFMYETNVGAGLPVISTLKDLINSGDQIIKIEGVLSGTLSFVFNNFKKGTSFCDILLEAHKLGYTEPDPRIDLS
ncbi:MAG: bifunctional aspartate kinase/homoserine dehydrogenase I, partial [Saprospiraceae bacterium]